MEEGEPWAAAKVLHWEVLALGSLILSMTASVDNHLSII